MNIAGDVNGIWSCAQAQDLRVETHRDVDVVLAGKKEQCVARGAELAVLLDGVDLVDLFLNGGRGHRRIEQEHVGSKIGLRCLRYLRGAGSNGSQTQHQEDFGKRSKTVQIPL